MLRWAVALLLFLSSAHAGSADVSVVLLRCDEERWQREIAPQKPAAARLLAVARDHQGLDIVNQAILQADPEKPAHWTAGKDLSYTKGWQAKDGNPFVLIPDSKETEFIGTVIDLEADVEEGEEAMQLKIALKHHVTEPAWTAVPYPVVEVTDSTLAKTRLQYPQFHLIEWKGDVIVKPGESVLAASMLVPPSDAKDRKPMRWFVIVTL